jgi:hypothetical protein
MIDMTKEQFIALGFTEEQATKAATASAEELKTYIPKHRFDEVNEENKTLKVTVKDNATQLETLKAAAGASEEMKKTIETLQTDNKKKDEEHQANLKDITLTNAIKIALAGKVHDETLAVGLVDKTKLVIDGDKVVGLDEQLKGLKETKSFLFKPDNNQTQKPGFKVGTDGQQQQQQDNKVSMKDAIAARIQMQQSQQTQ